MIVWDETGSVFHTYSAYGRGVEPVFGTYDLLDMTPKGRNEEGLSFPMAWVRLHDRYPESEASHTAATCRHSKERS